MTDTIDKDLASDPEMARMLYEEAARLRAENKRLQASQNPDLSNAQYHASLDKLWAAVPQTTGDVFDLVVAEIKRLREALVWLVDDFGDDEGYMEHESIENARELIGSED